MDRLAPLRVFVRVAELRSFTRAAASLGIPKASVSAHIQQLESEVGTQLLHRTTRQVRLTDDGMAFYERAQGVLTDADEIATMFKSQASQVSGRVRIDMSTRMARFFVIPRIQEFIEAHPNLQIELGATDRLVDLVHEGYDCVIRGGELTNSNLVARQIGAARVVNAASAAYLAKHGTPRSIKDLEHHYLIHYVSSFDERPSGFEYLEGKEPRFIKMKSYITVNNADSYAAACEAGLGIIQSPAPSLRESLNSGKLIEVLPKLRSAPLPIYVLYPHRRHLPRRVRVLIEWIESILRENYE